MASESASHLPFFTYITRYRTLIPNLPTSIYTFCHMNGNDGYIFPVVDCTRVYAKSVHRTKCAFPLPCLYGVTMVVVGTSTCTHIYLIRSGMPKCVRVGDGAAKKKQQGKSERDHNGTNIHLNYGRLTSSPERERKHISTFTPIQLAARPMW